MIGFQWIALTLLVVLIAVETARAYSGRIPRPIALLRVAVWLAAALAIADPNLLSQIAKLVGIQRGADLVMYLFIFAFLFSTFYLYSRSLRLERRTTHLIRQLALERAHRGLPAGEGLESERS